MTQRGDLVRATSIFRRDEGLGVVVAHSSDEEDLVIFFTNRGVKPEYAYLVAASDLNVVKARAKRDRSRKFQPGDLVSIKDHTYGKLAVVLSHDSSMPWYSVRFIGVPTIGQSSTSANHYCSDTDGHAVSESKMTLVRRFKTGDRNG